MAFSHARVIAWEAGTFKCRSVSMTMTEDLCLPVPGVWMCYWLRPQRNSVSPINVKAFVSWPDENFKSLYKYANRERVLSSPQPPSSSHTLPSVPPCKSPPPPATHPQCTSTSTPSPSPSPSSPSSPPPTSQQQPTPQQTPQQHPTSSPPSPAGSSKSSPQTTTA